MFIELSLAILFFLLWMITQRFLNIPRASLTWISGYSYFFIILLPSVFISNGIFIKNVLGVSAHAKPMVFLLSICGFMLFLASVMSAHFLARDLQVVITVKKRNIFRLPPALIVKLFILAVVLSFVAGAFDDIPLTRYLRGDPLYEILLSRSVYRSEFPLDLLFTLFAVFFTYFFLSVNANMGVGYRRLIVTLLILIVVYFQFGKLGRDDLVGAFLGFLVYRSTRGHISFLLLLCVPAIVMLGWVIFSPYDFSIYEMVLSIFNRIGTQTAFVYFHIDYVPSTGLMDDGVDAWWSSGKNINPSTLVYEDFYSRSGGSTAGYSFAKLWYVFKWLALPFVFMMFLLLIFLDRLLYRSKQIHNLNNASRAIHAIFVTFTTIPLLFNLTTVFSYQYVLSPMSLLLLSLIALFYNFKLLRRVGK